MEKDILEILKKRECEQSSKGKFANSEKNARVESIEIIQEILQEIENTCDGDSETSGCKKFPSEKYVNEDKS